MAKTGNRVKRPLTPAQLANLAKGNPKVAERHASGQYDSRILSDEELAAGATDDHQKVLELERGIRERDERIERMRERFRALHPEAGELDDDDRGQAGDEEREHCPTCRQPRPEPAEADDEEGLDDDDEPRRGAFGELWAGLTSPNPEYDAEPWEHTL